MGILVMHILAANRFRYLPAILTAINPSGGLKAY
jgi:hypothetical protein